MPTFDQQFFRIAKPVLAFNKELAFSILTPSVWDWSSSGDFWFLIVLKLLNTVTFFRLQHSVV